MDISELAKKCNFNEKKLTEWLRFKRYPIQSLNIFREPYIDDKYVPEIIEGFKPIQDELNAKKAEADRMKAEEIAEEEKRQKALASMLITSGFSFDGYTIKKYSGYISGDDVTQISRGRDSLFFSATNVGEALSESLTTIRRNALNELKQAAYDLGCNAVIGVDFDYITLEPETANGNGGTTYLPYVFCVTANGNAVIIEKDE